MKRRNFLSAVVASAAVGTLVRGMSADDLIVLPKDDIGQLKGDFNLNRDKVRMVFMLSPT
jgi:hypothetical protein